MSCCSFIELVWSEACVLSAHIISLQGAEFLREDKCKKCDHYHSLAIADEGEA